MHMNKIYLGQVALARVLAISVNAPRDALSSPLSRRRRRMWLYGHVVLSRLLRWLRTSFDVHSSSNATPIDLSVMGRAGRPYLIRPGVLLADAYFRSRSHPGTRSDCAAPIPDTKRQCSR
jgi:hypothetical protein